MGHLGTDDILLVAESDDIEAMPHMPRYEPSWFYEEVPSEMIAQCLRPRSRGGIDEVAAHWLHKHLVALGHAANARSCHFMAHSWFECAYGLKDGASELISSINMRLRLGQPTLARQLYERVLQQREVARIFMLTDAQREVATRKLAEAEAAIAARAGGGAAAMQDEMQQLLCRNSSGASVGPEEAALAVPLMRQQGHRANAMGDCEAAQLWFDCTFALSQQTADLLSAANMRAARAAPAPAPRHRPRLCKRQSRAAGVPCSLACAHLLALTCLRSLSLPRSLTLLSLPGGRSWWRARPWPRRSTATC